MGQFVAEAFFRIDTEDLSPPCWPRESTDQRVSLAVACPGGGGAAGSVLESQRRE